MECNSWVLEEKKGYIFNNDKLLTTNLLWANWWYILLKPSDHIISTYLNVGGFLGESYIINNFAKKSPPIRELQQANLSIAL